MITTSIQLAVHTLSDMAASDYAILEKVAGLWKEAGHKHARRDLRSVSVLHLAGRIVAVSALYHRGRRKPRMLPPQWCGNVESWYELGGLACIREYRGRGFAGLVSRASQDHYALYYQSPETALYAVTLTDGDYLSRRGMRCLAVSKGKGDRQLWVESGKATSEVSQ